MGQGEVDPAGGRLWLGDPLDVPLVGPPGGPADGWLFVPPGGAVGGPPDGDDGVSKFDTSSFVWHCEQYSGWWQLKHAPDPVFFTTSAWL